MSQCMTERLKNERRRKEIGKRKTKAGVGRKDEREAGREGVPRLY